LSQPLIIAFRGASRQAPENTVQSIKLAAEAHADIVALEVQGTKDDVPIVLADTKLDRTTNGTGRPTQLTLKEIQALDAGAWFGEKFKGAKIPTLEEGLEALGAKAHLMLDLSNVRPELPLAEKVAANLKTRKKPSEDWLVFNDSDSLKAFRDKLPSFNCLLVLGEKIEGWVCIEKAARLGLKGVRPYRAQIDAGLVRRAQAKQLKVFAFHTDEEDEMKKLAEIRVDGIVTGHPERLKEVLKSLA